MSEKNIALLLYITNAIKGVDYYTVFKVLYFAEQKHLAKYGDKLVEDDFHKLQYGPVPSDIYNHIKILKGGNPEALLKDFMVIKNGVIIEPLLESDVDHLSESEMECLRDSILENKDLSFEDLKIKSHQSAWQKTKSGKISSLDIAEEANASLEMLDYISFNLENKISIF